MVNSELIMVNAVLHSPLSISHLLFTLILPPTPPYAHTPTLNGSPKARLYGLRHGSVALYAQPNNNTNDVDILSKRRNAVHGNGTLYNTTLCSA